ncbi:MAG TPA: NUDIX hydrolase [Geminicoccus sp.]|jgi:8-oxo-dGTP pyrophosphatase MutT (NUDIX family)|nr:NUDIX hydrolase [Geminicoccus sp.]HEX2529145.1 NUDIX hydrolase [Geminicoccus sp.]
MVMLVTSRGTRRWIIPKGRPEKGVKPYRLAEQEALEEAGIVGRIGRKPIGRFLHPKFRPDGSTVTCQIEVFRLDVDRQLNDWPEKGQRERRWCTLAEAARLVDTDGLAQLLRGLDEQSVEPALALDVALP